MPRRDVDGVEPLVELRNVRAGYGRVEVLHGVSITLGTGRVLALLGPNGAGKSTILKVAGCRLAPFSGCVHVTGRHVNGIPCDVLARAGVCSIPEGRAVFPNLTVQENLLMMTHSGSTRAQVEDRAYATFPRLAERRRQRAGTMSGGEQQMLAMARAVGSDPAVLLLDEISMGLAPVIVDELYELVYAISRQGVSILLSEQFAAAALRVADEVAIVRQGRVDAVGAPDEVAGDLAGAYLGGVPA